MAIQNTLLVKAAGIEQNSGAGHQGKKAPATTYTKTVQHASEMAIGLTSGPGSPYHSEFIKF